jgi:hypothetical protein
MYRIDEYQQRLLLNQDDFKGDWSRNHCIVLHDWLKEYRKGRMKLQTTILSRLQQESIEFYISNHDTILLLLDMIKMGFHVQLVQEHVPRLMNELQHGDRYVKKRILEILNHNSIHPKHLVSFESHITVYIEIIKVENKTSFIPSNGPDLIVIKEAMKLYWKLCLYTQTRIPLDVLYAPLFHYFSDHDSEWIRTLQLVSGLLSLAESIQLFLYFLDHIDFDETVLLDLYMNDPVATRSYLDGMQECISMNKELFSRICINACINSIDTSINSVHSISDSSNPNSIKSHITDYVASYYDCTRAYQRLQQQYSSYLLDTRDTLG